VCSALTSMIGGGEISENSQLVLVGTQVWLAGEAQIPPLGSSPWSPPTTGTVPALGHLVRASSGVAKPRWRSNQPRWAASSPGIAGRVSIRVRCRNPASSVAPSITRLASIPARKDELSGWA
jgi:hypothetical protein